MIRTYYQGPRLPTRWELDQRLGLDQHEPDKSTERWRDAVHEAGHCLAAKDRGIESSPLSSAVVPSRSPT